MENKITRKKSEKISGIRVSFELNVKEADRLCDALIKKFGVNNTVGDVERHPQAVLNALLKAMR